MIASGIPLNYVSCCHPCSSLLFRLHMPGTAPVPEISLSYRLLLLLTSGVFLSFFILLSIIFTFYVSLPWVNYDYWLFLQGNTVEPHNNEFWMQQKSEYYDRMLLSHPIAISIEYSAYASVTNLSSLPLKFIIRSSSVFFVNLRLVLHFIDSFKSVHELRFGLWKYGAQWFRYVEK